MSVHCSTNLFIKRFCKRVLRQSVYVSKDEINPMLPYHSRLVEMLSTSALLYSLRGSADGMFITGLWLAYRSIHEDQNELVSSSLSLLLCAATKDPIYHDQNLEELIFKLTDLKYKNTTAA